PGLCCFCARCKGGCKTISGIRAVAPAAHKKKPGAVAGCLSLGQARAGSLADCHLLPLGYPLLGPEGLTGLTCLARIPGPAPPTYPPPPALSLPAWRGLADFGAVEWPVA